jgi:hypothetical protein
MHVVPKTQTKLCLSILTKNMRLMDSLPLNKFLLEGRGKCERRQQNLKVFGAFFFLQKQICVKFRIKALLFSQLELTFKT